SLSYAGLEAASNRLAWELQAQGVAAGSVVAVARRRSSDIAVAWLAVLKDGAAYLPVDPELPPERIAFMFADARAATAGRFAPGRRGVRDVHVWLDRRAERRRHPSPCRAAPRLRHRLRATRTGRHRRPDLKSRLRRVDLRVLGCAVERGSDRADRQDDRDRAACVRGSDR